MESANKINTMAASAVSEDEFKKVANKVSFITIVQNVLLSVFKLFAGIFAHSNAMISDAVHSASDVFSTIIVIIGVKLASKESDKEHPYGHERLECVAAIDPQGVYIQSTGSCMKKPSGGRFPLNTTNAFVKQFDGENDGLVGYESFKWGSNFIYLKPQGRRGISHGDVIDLNRENIDTFDVREFYVELVSDLKRRGF